MNGIVSSMMVMTLDIYRQIDTQDKNTGAIKKEWIYGRTVPCYAKGTISNSANTRSGDKEIISNRYRYQQLIEVRTMQKLSLREKITNIRNADGAIIWEELDYPNNTPTVFEVDGTTPITDPFGTVLGYNSTLKRAENQQIGL